jgi:1,4-dihydroxy-2-naphthoate octaprenyltransferase
VASPWVRVLRLEYQGDNFLTWFSASAIAIAGGAAFEPGWFLLGLGTLILAQAALELLDGYHDFVQGAHGRKREGDQVWTGGSGVLAEGSLRPASVRRAAWICGLAACALFAALTWGRTGGAGLVIGGMGAFCGAGWAMPPFKLSYRGLGEIAQAVVAGPLMAAMAWVIAAGSFDARALAIGIPFGLLELAMALAHNMIDAEPDARAGKRTLVVRIGPRAAAIAHGIAAAGAFAAVAILVATGVLPLAALLCLTLLPMAGSTLWLVRRAAGDRRALDQLARDFPSYRLLLCFGLVLVGVLSCNGLRSGVAHAPFLLGCFVICFTPVGLTLLARRRAS